jgi:hypothetical protein
VSMKRISQVEVHHKVLKLMPLNKAYRYFLIIRSSLFSMKTQRFKKVYAQAHLSGDYSEVVEYRFVSGLSGRLSAECD